MAALRSSLTPLSRRLCGSPKPAATAGGWLRLVSSNAGAAVVENDPERKKEGNNQHAVPQQQNGQKHPSDQATEEIARTILKQLENKPEDITREEIVKKVLKQYLVKPSPTNSNLDLNSLIEKEKGRLSLEFHRKINESRIYFETKKSDLWDELRDMEFELRTAEQGASNEFGQYCNTYQGDNKLLRHEAHLHTASLDARKLETKIGILKGFGWLIISIFGGLLSLYLRAKGLF